MLHRDLVFEALNVSDHYWGTQGSLLCSVGSGSRYTSMLSFEFSSLFSPIAIASVAFATMTCNALSYGGTADNGTDIAPAITKAYVDCVLQVVTQGPADTVLLVPSGTYTLRTAVAFHKANYLTIVIDGHLNLAFDATLVGNMFLFTHCDYSEWAYGRLHVVRGCISKFTDRANATVLWKEKV